MSRDSKSSKWTLLSGDINTVFNNVCTDSRNVKEGDIFVPLVGEKFDGHDYILPSFEKGALAVLHKGIQGLW